MEWLFPTGTLPSNLPPGESSCHFCLHKNSKLKLISFSKVTTHLFESVSEAYAMGSARYWVWGRGQGGSKVESVWPPPPR